MTVSNDLYLTQRSATDSSGQSGSSSARLRPSQIADRRSNRSCVSLVGGRGSSEEIFDMRLVIMDLIMIMIWSWIWSWSWSEHGSDLLVKPEDEEQHFQVFEGMVVLGGWRLMMWKRSVGGLWNMWKKGHDRTWRQWFTKDSFEFDDETSFEDQTPLKRCQCPGDHLREWKCHNIDANLSKSIQLLQHVNKSSLFFLKHYNEGDYLNN